MTIAQDIDFGLSPVDSSPENMSSMLYDDDLKEDTFEEELGVKPKKSTGRKGAGGADKRATHNAIERARRESLNGRFMTLAEALPSMANVKRPSKSVIVNKALDFVFDAQVKEHALVKENNDLRLQVDQLRARLGMAPLPPPEPLIAAVNITNTKSRSRSFEHFSRSFSSADGTFEDKANSMSGSMRHDSIVESPSSDLHSPGSIYSPQVAMPSPPLTDGNSPVLSFPPTTLFQTLDMASSTPSEGSHDGSRSLPTPSPFLPHAPQQQSHLLPGMGQQQSSAMLQSPFGYMNPSLLAQQHSLLIAAYANQQQQQAQFQHAHQQQQQQQQQHQLHAHHHSMQHGGQGQMQDMYGMSSGQQTGGGGAGGGMNWSVFGGAAGPMDTYSFMS